jgi:hypothetical protein
MKAPEEAHGETISDLWGGYYSLSGGKQNTLAERGGALPFTMGHEDVGTVESLGSEGSGIARGSRGTGGC